MRWVRAAYPGFGLAPWGHRRVSGILSLGYVLCVMAGAYYLFVPLGMERMTKELPRRATVLTVVFYVCLANAVVNLLFIALADPGRVPDAFKVAPVCEEAQPEDAAERPSGRRRYCTKCRMFKPDRAHHCGSCGRCVVRMDHHCPFTGNTCIGVKNLKFFLLFVYYALLGCVLVTFLTPGAIVEQMVRLAMRRRLLDIVQIVGILFAYLLCMVHAMALGGFAVFHTYLVLYNRTTIEVHEPRTAPPAELLQRYDRGMRNNWNMVFGPRPALWFLPVRLGVEEDVLTASDAV